MGKANFKTKKSLIDTLRFLKVGECVNIANKDFKFCSVRNAKYQLRREGIEIDVSERGLIGECKVTRLN